MLGCESRAAASASRSSRSSRRSALAPGRTALRATARPRSRSRASQTTPKPPRPISRTSSNHPTIAPGLSAASQVETGSGASACTRSWRSAERAPTRTVSERGVSPPTGLPPRGNSSESHTRSGGNLPLPQWATPIGTAGELDLRRALGGTRPATQPTAAASIRARASRGASRSVGPCGGARTKANCGGRRRPGTQRPAPAPAGRTHPRSGRPGPAPQLARPFRGW